MKSLLFFATSVVLCANAVLHVPMRHPSALIETENDGFDGSGHKLYQGDMILDEEQMELLNSSIDTRKGHHDDNYRWPNAQVQYRLDASSLRDRADILAGIQHWEDNTCIRFQEVPATYGEPHLIFKRLNGCFSHVGRVYYQQGQEISIGDGCTEVGTVAHEIGHAIGFHHEQSRPDRDSHVVVLNKNVEEGMIHNFNLERNAIDLGVAYDMSSLMHYGTDGFGLNNKNTLVTRDPFKHFLIGQRDALSFADIKLGNLMYKCSANCRSPPTCSNGGFVDENCRCVCAPGFSGATCQQGRAIVQAALTCGGNTITQPGTIQSPNFPSNYPKDSRCVWVVKAPIGRRVRATFQYFELEERWAVQNSCPWDAFELRTNDLFDGDKYCGSELSGKQVTSVSNTMVFVLSTDSDYYPGFQAKIDFV